MGPLADGPIPVTLRHLQRAVLSASDAQLTRIASVLDAMAERGDADAVIAPARARLAQLRPPRPLTFARLLFVPLDPLLVAGPHWARGTLGVPRTAVLPLAAQVRAAPDGAAAEVDAAIRGGYADDAALVLRAGTLLWPAAAVVLGAAGVPAGWAEATGLTAADHAAIVRCAACVLSEAVWIQTTLRNCAEGVEADPDDLQLWLETATQRHPAPPGALLAVLLARLPAAVALIGRPPPLPAEAGRHAETAIDFLLERLEAAPQVGGGPAEAAARLNCAAALLDGLEAPGPGQRPSRKPRSERLRRLLDESCRARFQEALSSELLAPLAAAPSHSDMTPLEETARRLRRLESAGRRLGSGERYDMMVRDAARLIGASAPAALIERVRLVEILAGPDAALALMRSGPSGM